MSSSLATPRGSFHMGSRSETTRISLSAKATRCAAGRVRWRRWSTRHTAVVGARKVEPLIDIMPPGISAAMSAVRAICSRFPARTLVAGNAVHLLKLQRGRQGELLIDPAGDAKRFTLAMPASSGPKLACLRKRRPGSPSASQAASSQRWNEHHSYPPDRSAAHQGRRPRRFPGDGLALIARGIGDGVANLVSAQHVHIHRAFVVTRLFRSPSMPSVAVKPGSV